MTAKWVCWYCNKDAPCDCYKHRKLKLPDWVLKEISKAVAEERERILAVADGELGFRSCGCLKRLNAAIREASA